MSVMTPTNQSKSIYIVGQRVKPYVMVFDAIVLIFSSQSYIPTYTGPNQSLIWDIKNHEFIWILSFVTHIYLFTPLSWCHDFGKLKYFTNRSRRTFCGIQTEDSKNLFSSTLLDFSPLEFQFYSFYILLLTFFIF